MAEASRESRDRASGEHADGGGDEAARAVGEEESARERRLRRAWTVVILLFVAISGLGLQMRGALLPVLGEQWGLTDGTLGLVGPAGILGSTLTVLGVGATAGRIDTRRFVLGGLALTTVAVVGMGLSPVFVAFLGFLVVRSLGSGAVRALDRPMLSHFYPHARGRVFNLYDLAWAVGAAAGPAVMTVAIARGDWRLAYYGLTVAFAALTAAVFVLGRPADGAESPLELGDALALLQTPAVVAAALALALHTGLEGTLFLWLPTFGGDVAGLDTGRANLLLSAFVIAYVPGRLVYTVIAERIGYARLVVALEVLIVPVFVWTFFVAEGLAIFAGVVVLGALVSGVFPTLVAFATDAAPEYSGPVNAISAATGSLALAMVPFLVGGLSEVYGIRQAMWLPLLLTVSVAPVVLLASRADSTPSV